MDNIKKIALIGVGSRGWIGGIYYILNIINALDKLEKGIEIHLFETKKQNFPDLSKFTNVQIYRHNYEELFSPSNIYNKIYGRVAKFIFNYKNPRVERYLIKNKFDYVFPERLSSHKGKLNIGSWIADFQFINHPDGSSQKNIALAKKTIYDIINKSNKIILSSKAIEKECHSFFPETKEKTNVMPFAVYINENHIKNNLTQIKKKYNLPDRFLVVSNLFAPTKNHKTLFKAISLLKKQGLRIPLFCTGNFVDSRNLEFPNEILSLITDYNIRNLINILGQIPREEQIAIYRQAIAIVQPSFHEGWNTTVEEAKALGKFIILSDIAVHKEQMPTNKNFFDPHNETELADKILNVWDNTKDIVFPDTKKEAKSLLKYNKNVKDFGLNFLRIASK